VLKIGTLRPVFAVLAPLTAIAWALPASAEAPVETAVKAWVAAIDASPEWQAAYAGLTVDSVTGKATLTGLSVKSEQPGFSLTFATVTVDGFRETNDGTFTAQEIDLDGGDIKAGAFSLRIANAAIDAPVLPESGGFVWDDAAPFVSAIHALALLTRAAAASARARSITVVETVQGIQTQTTYNTVKVAGWRNGKVAAISAGPVKTESPSPNPLVTLSMDTTETRDVDLNALVAVYDPARYTGGVGDGVWLQAIGHAAYHKVAIGIPGVTLTIGDTAVDGFRMRQAKAPPLLAPAADDPSASLADQLLRRLDALATYGVDRFATTNLDVAISGLDRAHLDGLTVSDVSTERIGDLALTSLALAISDGGGTIDVGKLALGGLALPSSDTIRAALAAQASGGNVQYSSLIPPLTYVEAGGIDVALSALPPVQLGRFRVDLGAYAVKVPTAIGLDLVGADVPAALIPDERAQHLLASFGYDRVHVDAGAHVDWSDAGEIAIKDFHFAMKDVGGLSGTVDLLGIKPSAAQHIAAVEGAVGALSLKSGTFTFADDSIVGRALAAQAARLNADPAKFRQQFATGLPFMLAFLNNRDLQAQLAPVLQTFVRTSGSITAVANPAAPVPLSAIVAAAETAPFTLFSLLSVSVSGVAGPAPATQPTAVTPTAPAPAPAN
jgi:hypothetical protein